MKEMLELLFTTIIIWLFDWENYIVLYSLLWLTESVPIYL